MSAQEPWESNVCAERAAHLGGFAPPGPPAHFPAPVAPDPYLASPIPASCQACGRGPTADVSFVQVIGMAIMFRRVTVSGRFCSPCGMSLFRKQTNKTLMTGWLGLIAFFANLVALIDNFKQRKKLLALGEPAGFAVRPPLDPGASLPRRSGLWVMLAGVIAIVGLGLFVRAQPEKATLANVTVGTCVRLPDDGKSVLAVRCSQQHDAKVVKLIPPNDECPDRSIPALTSDTLIGCVVRDG
jgi:hypothetical protein